MEQPKRRRSAQLNVRLTDEEYEEFSRYCRIKDISQVDFVAMAIREKMEKQPLTEAEKMAYKKRLQTEIDSL